jgi:uncharacterized protein YggE
MIKAATGRFALRKVSMALMVMAGIGNAQKFVNIYGESKIRIYPDQAILTCGVSSVNKKADVSAKKAAKVTENILRICRKYGVDPKDISTKTTEIKKDYRNDQDTTTYLGIKARTIFEIRLANIDSITVLANELYRNGMNEFEAVEFATSKEDSAKKAASQNAMKDAYENAKCLLKAQGKEVGELLSVSFDKPEDFDQKEKSKIDDLLGGLWLGEEGPGDKDMLEYLKIMPRKIAIEAKVYAKYSIK